MKDETKHFYKFKSFRLNVGERQLLYHNSPVPLTPKAFDVLALLVERGGHLVEKEELMQTVWADSFVEEQNITRIIHTLRKTLGEDKNSNKFIETVAKKGYRFVVKVTEVREADEPEPNGRQLAVGSQDGVNEELLSANRLLPTEILPRPRVVASPRLILFAVGFLSAVFVIVLLSFNFRFSSTNPNKAKSIAVLPVKPINAANRDEIYEVGIADSLILRLNSMTGFVVRPLNATRKYSAIEQDPLVAGKEQQVDYVLVSNYQIADGKIRVTVQLFNVSSGQIEETYKSEKDAGDIFAMQDAIADDVGNKLLTRFALTESSSVAKRGTNNEDAYRLYLQGMYLVGGRNAADARKAIEALEQAVKIAPNYAMSWAGLAHARRAAGNFGRSANLQEEHQKSIEAINKALALDANSADAYSALCESKFSYEWDFDGAEIACKRAIELNPNSSLAHQIYARYLNSRGRFDEAINEIKTAIDLEPASLFNQRLLGVCLHYARRYDEAVVQFKRVVVMNEDFGTTYSWLSMTLAFQGKEAEAFEVWMKNLERQKADEETVHAFQTAFQTSGWQGVMRLRAERFEKGNEIYFHSAAYNAQIENKEKAFEYLEKSYRRREWGMGYLQVDPRFDNLRDDSRFIEFVRQVEKE